VNTSKTNAHPQKRPKLWHNSHASETRLRLRA
jgi:hypothetical protein